MGSSSKVSCFTDPALSDSGIVSMTSRELEIHLVRQNPPFASSRRSSSTRKIARRLVLTDFKQSSTEIAPNSVYCLIIEVFPVIVCSSLQPEISAAWRGRSTKQMHHHLVFLGFFVQVILRPPHES